MKNEQELAQFTETLEAIVSKERVDGPLPVAFAGELGVARELVGIDLSGKSAIRAALRARLLQSNPQPRWSARARTAPVMVLLIVIAALMLTPLGNALAQSIVRILNRWQLGEETQVVQVEGDFQAERNEDGEVELSPANGDEAPLPPDDFILSPYGNNLSLDAARKFLDFPLLSPSFIPGQYVFQGVTVLNAEQASIDYVDGKGGLIGLTQTVAAGINGAAQVTISGDLGTTEVEVNGENGLWIQADPGTGVLVWEAEGISYQLQLGSAGGLELALRVAESLHE